MSPNFWPKALAVCTGILLGLALLKLGNPVVLEDRIEPPQNFLEWIIQPWPLDWGYALLAGLALLGFRVWRWRSRVPIWVQALPAVWLAWQVAAAMQSVDARLSGVTVAHFAACVGCFYVGLFALSRVPSATPLWLAWTAGFALMLAVGLQQHFGGLEETRRWFYAYELPQLPQPPSKEFMQKLASNRIYATLFYPNTLAGAILLVLPAALVALSGWTAFTAGARSLLAGLVAWAALACLFWSGSKAGWLILLCVGLIALWRTPVKRPVKLAVTLLALAVGLAGFVVKYRDYLAKGATSLAARADYWRAAWEVIRDKPVFGSGPGTFGVIYRQSKSPGAEMARLAHNDYLQQGSDSGLPGLLAYAALVVGSLGLLWRKAWSNLETFGVWLGLLGLAVHSALEFNLFIPALAWPQFLLLGWLWARTTIVGADADSPS